MPPKTTISRDKILDAALELVREEGLAGLSARRIARRLGCSTQPIYWTYGSMEKLRAEVLARVAEVARSYLAASSAEKQSMPFLQVGLGSLRFARDEPQLYRLVAQSGIFFRDLEQGKPPPDFVLQQMRADPHLAGLTDEQLTRINALMFFFSQGLATLFGAELDQDPMSMATEYLALAGQAVVELERRRAVRDPREAAATVEPERRRAVRDPREAAATKKPERRRKR
jgi:AcrR family transcriptional regulator